MNVVIGRPKCIRGATEDANFVVWSVTRTLERSDFPSVVRLVCDAMTQEHLDRVFAHVRRHSPATEISFTDLAQLKAPPSTIAAAPYLVRPTADENLVRGNAWDNKPSLEWYTKLLYYALNQSRSNRCCVLWGPPGAGKTLAIERIGEILKLRHAKRGIAEVHMLGAGRREIVELGYFSCASTESADDIARFVCEVEAFGTTANRDSILVVDDIEVFAELPRVRDSLTDILVNSARCRRILIVNDFYSDAIGYSLRQRSLSEKLFLVRVPVANFMSLVEYLTKKFPRLATEQRMAERIADRARGDVRAAIIAATMAMATGIGSSAEAVGLTHDAKHRQSEKLDDSLARCIRSTQPEKQCRAAHFEHDIDVAAQMIYANTPRWVTAGKNEIDELEQLSCAADVLDWLSLYDVYGEHQRDSFYSGGDAEDIDKELSFEFGLVAPVQRLALALTGTSRSYGIEPGFELPFKDIAHAQQTSTALLSEFSIQQRRCAAPALPCKLYEESVIMDRVASADVQALCEIAPIVFAQLPGDALEKALRLLLGEEKARKNPTVELVCLKSALLKCREIGVDLQAAVWLCQMRLAVRASEERGGLVVNGNGRVTRRDGLLPPIQQLELLRAFESLLGDGSGCAATMTDEDEERPADGGKRKAALAQQTRKRRLTTSANAIHRRTTKLK